METRKRLAEALKKMMAEKPLSKISIRDLTDACAIRRQSFYYYFEDIYDLMKWGLHQEAERIIRRHGNMMTWQEAMLDIFDYVQENKAQCLCILNSGNRDYLDRFFYDDLRSIFNKSAFPYMEIIRTGKDNRELMEFYLHYLAISLTALFESWAKGNIKASPEYILKALEILLVDQVNGSMKRDGSVEETLEKIRMNGIEIKLP